jgi:hypothetical protein
MDEAEVKLRHRESSNDRLALFAASAVAFGLALETAIACIYPQPGPWLEQHGPLVADFLVFGGVCGELWFSHKSKQASEKLRGLSDIKTVEANERAAEANRRAEEARKRTAELEEFTAPRRLSTAQKVQLVSALRSLNLSLNPRIEFERGDAEAWMFARQIAEALNQVTLKELSLGSNSLLGEGVFGVTLAGVQYGESVEDVARAFASVGIAIGTVNQNGIPPNMRFPHGGEAINLWVFIGAKPLAQAISISHELPGDRLDERQAL